MKSLLQKITPYSLILVLGQCSPLAWSAETPLVLQPLTDPPLQSTPALTAPPQGAASGVYLPYLTMQDAARAGVNPASGTSQGYVLNSSAIPATIEPESTSWLQLIKSYQSKIALFLLIAIAGGYYIYRSEFKNKR